MNVEKSYILYIDNEISLKYALGAMESCIDVGVSVELFKGFYNQDPIAAWNSIGFKRDFEYFRNRIWYPGAQLTTAGHVAIWKKIADNKECAVILEHDAIMLHSIDMEIPENYINVIGYKTDVPSRYNHVSAGPPTIVRNIKSHQGAHAYVIDYTTANLLLEELEVRGIIGAIDNTYFIRDRDYSRTTVPMNILLPTPAIGWVRKSTLWENPSTRNENFEPEFSKYWKWDECRE